MREIVRDFDDLQLVGAQAQQFQQTRAALAEEIGALAKARFKEERSLQRLDGWFLIKEIRRRYL